MQKPTVVNESGLYSILFSMQPQKANKHGVSDAYPIETQERIEKLKRFKRWVTHDVLPTIRKTGGYVNDDEMFVNIYLPFADDGTKKMFSQILKTVREQNEMINQQNNTISRQRKEIVHKEDVIIGLVDDIDLATKRQRITQIVRYGAKNNYRERYRLLYSEFEKKYHCNLKMRMSTSNLKPKVRNKMDYIDRETHMIPQLYEIACKLFENDVEKLKEEWESTVTGENK